MTQPIPQNAYLVANGTGTLYPTVIFARDPTLNDLNGPNGQKYQVTQRWVNSVTNKEWFLLNFTTSAGYYQANWVQIAGGSVSTETLTGDSGVATASANNINVYGNTSPASTGLTFTGSGNTLALGGDLVVANGGTGRTSLTAHNVLLGEGSSPVGFVAPSATSGIPLISQGSAADPIFGTVGVAGGGTGDTSFIPYEVIVANTTSTGALTQVSGVGTAGQVLTSNGAAAFPTWQSVGLSSFAVNLQAITSTGTYTPTAGMAYCIIQCVGGGGAGGGSATTVGISAGSGGGAGEYAVGVFSAATIGASQSVTIGGAGAGASGTTGGNGGNTSVGSLITADGGTGGTVVNLTSNGFLGALGGIGGTGGSGGTYRTKGGQGGSTFIISVSMPSFSLGQSGSGGVGFFAGGVAPNVIINNADAQASAGIAATGYGGGGSGSLTYDSTATSGGNGSAGIVVITEYIT
jgi:hypothetical protein